MTPRKQQRLIIIILALLSIGLGCALLFTFFRDNLVYFYGPSEIPASIKPSDIIRIGGLVEKGSLQHLQEPIGIRFRITDRQNAMTIEYHGVLPDLFREGQGIVAEGNLISPGHFLATQVLAKHDENYTPPDAQKALDRAEKKAISTSLTKP